MLRLRGGWLLSLLLCCAPEHVVEGRPYDLQQPPEADPTAALPLIVLAHGYGSSGWSEDVVMPFSKQVGAQHFLYALPNGTLDDTGHRFWNATDACCNFDHLPVDDVGFFRSLIADVKSQRPVSKVFVIGHSNGAFMALRLACEASDVIDGVVSMAGSAWQDFSLCPDGRKIPILLVHGTADAVIPYDGKDGQYPSAHGTGELYARRAGCNGAWAGAGSLDFVGDSSAETHAEVIAGCEPAITLWSIDGAGHIPTFDSRWTAATIDWLMSHTQ